VLRLALLLGVPFLWYALGPIGGLFRMLVRLPGFANVELPMHGWFLPALGLALLAAAGVARLGRPRLTAALIAITMADVLVLNQLRNPLAYARQPFDVLYAAPLATFDAEVDRSARVYGPPMSAVSYRNHALQSRVETTYGYNPLELAGYAAYADAAERDPGLIAGFAAALQLAPDGTLVPLPAALPLATFPNDATAMATVVERGPDHLVVRYASSAPAMLRIAVAYFPGWHATLDGRELPLETVDGAFIGVDAPPGSGEIELRYQPRFFAVGATISALALLLTLALFAVPSRRKDAGSSDASRGRADHLTQ
jgi:hypothetical protein